MNNQELFWFKNSCFPSFILLGWVVTTQKLFILSMFQKSSFNLKGFAWVFSHLQKITWIGKSRLQLEKGKCCTHLQKKTAVMETTV